MKGGQWPLCRDREASKNSFDMDTDGGLGWTEFEVCGPLASLLYSVVAHFACGFSV